MKSKLPPGRRILWAGYTRILALLVAGPVHWRDVCAAVGVSRLSAARYLHQLHDAGLTHRCGWHVPDGPGGARGRVPVYAFGPGVDAEHPCAARARRPRCAVELLAFIHCVREMMHDSHDGKSLAATSGLTPRTACSVIRELHRAELIYKAEYHPRSIGGWGYPLYRWGPGTADKRKPPPMSKRELWTKHNRIKQDRLMQAKLLGLLPVRFDQQQGATA